jgi:hypothetical protein
MSPVHSLRLIRRYTQHIDAVPAVVFPLLCPVREGEWADGWARDCELIHSESGLAEEGCVFRTRPVGQPETVWVITRHDAAAGAVEFCRVTTGLAATRLAIRVEPEGAAASSVHVTYTATALGPEGRAFLTEDFDEAGFKASMKHWEDSMNHWLRTGQLLRAA